MHMQSKKEKCETEAMRQPEKSKSETPYIPEEKLTGNTLIGQKMTETKISIWTTSLSEVSWSISDPRSKCNQKCT